MGDLIRPSRPIPRASPGPAVRNGGTDHILVGQIAKAAGGARRDQLCFGLRTAAVKRRAAIPRRAGRAGVSGVGEWADFIASGEMRPLAVPSDARLDVAPDVPTLVEGGVDVVPLNWRGAASSARPTASDEDRRGGSMP